MEYTPVFPLQTGDGPVIGMLVCPLAAWHRKSRQSPINRWRCLFIVDVFKVNNKK
jgi:hypothetical protein